MALTVSIIRQPLYGSVYWNGNSFIYTPNAGFSGSDSFVYSEYVDGVKNIYTKYVNSSNTPPVSLSTTLSVNPYITTEINLNSVVVDYNNPFNYLQFIDVSSSLSNTIKTDGNKIYYTPDTASASDIITYTVTDKQFTITGQISVNVLSAEQGAAYTYSPLEKLYQFKQTTNSYEANSSGWTGSYNVYSQYGSVWDTIDLTKYEGFANEVVAGYAPWNSIYDYRNIYYSVYTTISAHSGRWVEDISTGNYYYGIINPKALLWNDVYSILNSGSAKWNNTITNFNIVSSGLSNTQPSYVSVYTTVNTVSNIKWYPNDLNDWNNTYFNLFKNLYTYTSGNSAKWIVPISSYQALSSGMSNVVDNIKSTSNSVYINSAASWDNSNLNYLSAAYYDKWTLSYKELSSNQNKFNVFATSVNSISSGIDKVNRNSNSLFTTISSNSATLWNDYENETFISNNSANWFSLFSELTGLSSTWYTSNPIVSIINSNTPTFNLATNVVSANSGTNWSNLDSNSNLILATSSILISLYNNLNTLTATWGTPGNISSIIQSVSSKFNSYYNTVLTNLSSLWNDSNNTLLSSNSSNWLSVYSTLTTLSSNWNPSNTITSVINSISSTFNSYYTTVLTNLSSLWNSSNNTLLSSNSGNWLSVYSTLTTLSSNWASSNNVATSIGSVSSNFNSLYSTGLTNTSSLWSNDNNTLLSTYSGNWVNTYNIITSGSSGWSSGKSLSSAITNDKSRYTSTYNTLTANSGKNWTGMTIYASISDNIVQFQNLRQLFYVVDSDSYWSGMQAIYNQIFTSYNYYYPYFNSTRTSTQNGSSFWDTTYVNRILSGLSANLTSNYNLLTASTSYWVFAEDQNLKNTFTYVSANSSALNTEYNVLTSRLTSWTPAFDNSIVPSLSNTYLSGDGSTSLTARNIKIYGNLVVGTNLSALGSKTSISTSNYSLTGFEVTDTSTTDCFVITKSSNLNNVATFSSVSSGPVLWILANNTVGINTTTPNQALTIVGNISASGTISNYLGSQITLLTANSTKYESAFTFVTTNSGFLTAFNASKVFYDDMTNYYNNSSAKINTLTSSIPLFTSISNNISSNYLVNNNINIFVTYSTGNAGIDTIYRTLTGKYDNTYNSVTSVCANQITSLNYLFSFNKVVSSDTARLIIPYNLKINSWSIFADQPTNLTIEVLSGYIFNKRVYTTSLTNNQPITASNTAKATANQLDTLGWTTSINAGGNNLSFIQFNLTRNDSASAVMVNLKAYKI